MRKDGFPKKFMVQAILLLAAAAWARGDEFVLEPAYLERAEALGDVV